MSEATVSPILALAALLIVPATLALTLAVEAPGARQLRILLADHGQVLALLVTGVATAGSLYYSEYVGFVPCEFCWYQRIAMYPLAVMFLVAVVTRADIPARYTAVIAAIGLALSIYHYQLQLFPEQAGVCSGGVPCNVQYVNEFGMVSIPFMAGCGFLAVLLILLARWRAQWRLSFEDWDDAEA